MIPFTKMELYAIIRALEISTSLRSRLSIDQIRSLHTDLVKALNKHLIDGNLFPESFVLIEDERRGNFFASNVSMNEESNEKLLLRNIQKLDKLYKDSALGRLDDKSS